MQSDTHIESMNPFMRPFLYCALLTVALAPVAVWADFQATSPTTTTETTTTTNVDGSQDVKQVTHNPDGSSVTVETVTYLDGTRTSTTTTVHADGTQTVETTTVNPPPTNPDDRDYGNSGGNGGNSANGGFGQTLANAATQALMQNMMRGGGFNPQQVMGNMVNGLTGAAGLPAASPLTTGSIKAPGAMAGTDATKALDKADTDKTKAKPKVELCKKPMTDEEKKKQADDRQAQLQGAPDGQREALNAKFEKEDAARDKLPKCPEVDYTKPNGVSSKITSLADAKALVGKQVGVNQQCAVLAETLAPGIGRTATWQKGLSVKDNDIPVGTPIATFNYQDGTAYAPVGSRGEPGSSHSAIFLSKDSYGVTVLNQWNGSRGAQISTIPWSAWGGNAAEGGSRYYTIVPAGGVSFNLMFRPFWLAWNVIPFDGGLLKSGETYV